MSKKVASGNKKLVIVESPTKARTIRKFLGQGFEVESCMGHVRDLPQSAKDIPEKFKKQPWSNLGVNVDEGFEPIYCVPKAKVRVVKELKDKLKEADELILATDEDREGESISWHLIEVLKPKVPVKRMVFHEITQQAIHQALEKFRDVDDHLVRAQEARRVLDRLVGYTISPLLWKKVAYGLSAGRVQSVAVRLISEREHERLRFKSASYWGLVGHCNKDQIKFDSRLISYNGQRIATSRDFDSRTGELLEDKKKTHLVLDGAKAQALLDEIGQESWRVQDVEEKPVSRRPAPPFITSTLQQEANRKLKLSSKETMDVAQKLYERGFITYMRTDSVNLSDQALKAARDMIQSLYGSDYLPDKPRSYLKKKVKGAQEAHEAIRPAGTEFLHPGDTGLTGVAQSLYELIWKRTLASQMVDSRHKQVSVKLTAGSGIFSASGMTIEFPGFLKAYVEGKDDPEAALDNREVRLPQLVTGDSVACDSLEKTQHETKPPARFTEATLVQTLEKEGIGRPSTYAAIISTIQNRGYVRKMGNALVPTFTALVVSKLLRSYLPNYVDTDFTSKMEESLDEIAAGELNWQKYLNSIYFGNKGLKTTVEEQEEQIDGETSRSIVLDGLDGLEFRVGRYGAYVCRRDKGVDEPVCASLPETQIPGDITREAANKLIDQKISGADALGNDPETGLPVYVLTGRYGPYVQLGDSDAEKSKPKRTSIPPQMDPENLNLDQALQLLSLPKTLGMHPGLSKEIKVGLGRFGPYVVCDGDFRSIPKGESLFEVNLERALELLAQPKKTRGRAVPLKELGEHPQTSEPMAVYTGKYGPYVKCGKVNVSVPDDVEPQNVTPDQAVEWLKPRMETSGQKKKAKKKSSSAKKKVAKKAKKVAKKAKTSRQKAGASKKASSAGASRPKSSSAATKLRKVAPSP